MSGRNYWKSLEEQGGDPAMRSRVEEYVRREHPSQVDLLADPVQRRTFLQLMGASMALAGVSSCTRQPDERIYPYAKSPEALVPGVPLYFATAMPWASGAIGVLAESHMGRPTKLEGNELHPASLGATDAMTQASVLGLYDPERSQVVLHRGRISTWDAFSTEIAGELEAQKPKQGLGLRIVTETVVSPTLAAQLDALLAQFPRAKWTQYEPVNRDFSRTGALFAFKEDVAPRFDLAQAEVVVAFESDLFAGPGGVRHARAFASRRRDAAAMSRAYAVESSITSLGAMADHRLALPPSGVERVVRALAAALGVSMPANAAPQLEGAEAQWVAAVARDLEAHRGRSLVLAGEPMSAMAHALANAMNVRLSNVGATVTYGPPADARPVEHGAAIDMLAQEMQAGVVEVLIVLGANPVYTAPANFEFASLMEKVRLRVHLGLHADETAELCHWHLPEAHYLESWSDARAFDGSLSPIQPLIAPLYGGRSAHELVAILAGQPGLKGYELVRMHWKSLLGLADAEFEQRWRRALHDGVLEGTAVAPRGVKLETFDPGAAPTPSGAELEIAFRADSSVWDGRFANNGWLQEVPRPITQLTWDNAALIGPRTAAERALSNGDEVELTLDGRKLRCAVWIVPGHADGCVTLHLGYGRTHAGKVGNGAGFNAYALRSAESAWNGRGLTLTKLGTQHVFACAQMHHDMEGRDLVRETTPLAFAQGDYGAPKLHAIGAHAPETSHGAADGHAQHAAGEHPSLYAGYKYEGNAWGLSIDLSSCVGCNACVVACQAENNIPVVGKEQVHAGREMQWIRIDRYFSGRDASAPRVRFQPITCMHCENAPCEVVCPVGATVHGPEGLNEMVYNRCIGTKYCSNNCPYKVRRFNFFLYADFKTPSLKLQRNPDVTVRSRGVMEKCTYCVQRINAARIQAKKEDRALRDGEIVTACQQVCPAQAITFGDINNAASAVAKKREQPHHYGLLTELNTRPRTTYLARLSNPNPELPA